MISTTLIKKLSAIIRPDLIAELQAEFSRAVIEARAAKATKVETVAVEPEVEAEVPTLPRSKPCEYMPQFNGGDTFAVSLHRGYVTIHHNTDHRDSFNPPEDREGDIVDLLTTPLTGPIEIPFVDGQVNVRVVKVFTQEYSGHGESFEPRMVFLACLGKIEGMFRYLYLCQEDEVRIFNHPERIETFFGYMGHSSVSYSWFVTKSDIVCLDEDKVFTRRGRGMKSMIRSFDAYDFLYECEYGDPRVRDANVQIAHL